MRNRIYILSANLVLILRDRSLRSHPTVTQHKYCDSDIVKKIDFTK